VSESMSSSTTTAADDDSDYTPNWGAVTDSTAGSTNSSEDDYVPNFGPDTPDSGSSADASVDVDSILHGSPLNVVNLGAALMIVGIVLALLVGFALDKRFAARSKKSREPFWVISLLVMSYLYLIPGLFCVLFSFNMFLDLGPGQKFGIGPGGGFNMTPGTTETMIGLVKLLNRTGSTIGAVLVVTYAIIIPAIKLLLVFVGNFLQNSVDWAKTSRRCIQAVQNLSKWACPDMFAYILLMYLVKSLDHPPKLICAGRLDLGFAFFSLFCVGSTVASLGIRVPDREHGWWQAAGRSLGMDSLIFVVGLLFASFCLLFFGGASNTVMALQVGHINESMDMFIQSLGLTQFLHSEVSIWKCIGGLAEEVGRGEVDSLLGFIMMAVFVVGITVLDMLVLVSIAVLFKMGRKADGVSLMKISWYLKKLSMLDVHCMGVAVVTLCMLMYRSQGVMVSMGQGQVFLVIAEVVHYIAYYTVKGTVEFVSPIDFTDSLPEDTAAEDKEEEDFRELEAVDTEGESNEDSFEA